jgi:dihydrofolate synthase/folylpolyglutamate synthase
MQAGEAAYEAAVTKAEWPARMQRLKTGPLIDAAPEAELWLDGGHNPAAGQALADLLQSLPKRPTHLVVGILNTKDITGYLSPLAQLSDSLTGVSIPGEANTIPGEKTAQIAADLGMKTAVADTVLDAVRAIASEDSHARILICGSLYLAGSVLRENG